ncbi:FAD-dependent monooxygenase [Streptomyces sp. P38-E01]|uniref:FAD-dependent monooxygenase n=1 Tax=Streptomyces tardus TaxID=2780544 RepID=A0A949JAS4_9ACTN|nr:NAD(P)/FAD-dependent oxidoreductase [Streptomyces tardus]MBU7596306.1 FAD-dependent monooxygenase [Streptomyces tardus]
MTRTTGSTGEPGSAVIVGAGIGGLACALGLRRAGWQVTVLERRPEPARYGTAFGIHPTAQSALERLGVGAELHARAVPYREAYIRSPQGRPLARLPLERIERREGRPELLLSRHYLLDAMLGALDDFGDVRISHGERVTDALGLADRYDVVIGADGIGSTVRTAHFGERSAPKAAGNTAWIGIADFESPIHGETWGAGSFVGMTPIEPGCTNWYAVVPRNTTIDELPGRFRGWHHPVPRLFAETDRSTWIRYEMRHLAPALRSFVSTRGPCVALLGDAAHAMTPNLGQGACTAVLDAEALARALAVHGRGARAAALHAYDSERRRSAQRIALGSRTLHRVMSTRHVRLRDRALRLLP